MKMTINEEHICNTCKHHVKIAGCDCCTCVSARWDVEDGKFKCHDYEAKKEVNDEKKKL